MDEGNMSYSEQYAKMKLDEMKRIEKSNLVAKKITRVMIIIALTLFTMLIFSIIHTSQNRPEWQKKLDTSTRAELLKVAKSYYVSDDQELMDRYLYMKDSYGIVCQLDPNSTEIGKAAEKDVFCKFYK